MSLEIGVYYPEKVLTNKEIASWRIPTSSGSLSEEDIFNKIGVRQRFIAGEDETALSMAIQAVNGLSSSPDAIFFSTSYPDKVNNAEELAKHFDLKPTYLMNVHAACSGFVTSLVELNKNNAFLGKRILIATGEIYSRSLPNLQRGEEDPGLTQTIFSDGATGTSFISGKDLKILAAKDLKFPAEDDDAILMPIDYEKVCFPAKVAEIANNTDKLLMHGKRVLRSAIREIPSLVLQTVNDSGLDLTDIKMVIPHQASKPMLEAITRGLPEFSIFRDMEDGNFSSGSIPNALRKALCEEQVKPGDNLVLVAMGAGLFASAAVVHLG